MVSIELVSTASAIEDYFAHVPRQVGQHLLERQIVGPIGLDTGTEDFDPARHDPIMIDTLSPFQEVTGQAQVRQVLPYNPAIINLIADYRSNGSEILERTRKRAIDVIIGSLMTSLPSMDRINAVGIDKSPGQSQEEVDREIIDESSHGLTIVAGSFEDFTGKASFENPDETIALKVNHPLEREFPAGVGKLAIGGGVEVDTCDQSQLDYVNGRLQQRHERVVQKMLNAGVSLVVPIITAPKHPSGLNATEIDEKIAGAVSHLLI